MFKIDIFGNSEPLSLYVCKPDGTILGCIDKEIDENSVSLSMGINEEYELEFDIIKTDNSDSKWFDYLDGGMYLLLEKIGIFKINQPPITLDGVKSQKKISASGCDIELEDKTVTLELNMGTKTSQEYLVKYEDGETENLVNPYTGLPYDWLVLYNYFPEQLALFKTFVTGGNELGHSTRNVVDSSRIERFMSMVKLIPRLLNKIDYDENTGDYSLTEYMVITYANDGETVTNIQYRGDDLVDRIDELITFYTKYRHQLSLLSLVLEETGGDWTVGNIYGVSENDFTLANKKFQYSADETIRSFLKQTLAKDTNCIVSLDVKSRTVNMTPVEEIGSDTGIVMSYDKLVNSMNITSNDERFTTRLYVTGKDDLGIRQVNFGLPYIDDISYYLNALDENGNRKYVSDDFATKYEAYQTDLEAARASYIEKALAYNKVLKEIDELKYRVPLDDLSTDWGTFRQDELEETLKNYKNLLAALIALYKEDYGTVGVNNDGSVKESYLKTTEYNYDYFAYQGIINEIKCALATFPYYSNQEKWTSAQLTEYKDSIAAWETNWSLYGTVELQAKIKTFSQNMDVLADSSVVRYSASSDYYDSTNQRQKSWDELTSSQKATFNNIASNSGISGDTGETAYYYAIKPYNSLTTDEQHKLETPNDYFYDEYMEHYRNYISASAALAPMNTTLTQLETDRDAYLSQRAAIADSVKLENNFNVNEIKLLHRLFRDSDYSNENILTTSISDEDEKIEKMQELLEDGRERLSIYSRPQLKFEVDAENIFGLPEFEKLWSQLVPGNFILVQYVDNIYVRLRLTGFTFNPSLPSSKSLSIRFSNYLLSKSEYSDIESLFGESMGSSGRGGSSGSGSGDGNYGQSDDIDITISNTMIAKLLNTEQFGTRVTNIALDTLDVNKLTARSAKFQGLANGTTLIDGGCLKTGEIQSNNYTYDRILRTETGSILRLNDGTFSFGGGKLKWDGNTLSLDGDVRAATLATGNRASASTGTAGIFIDASGNLYGGANNETIIKADGTVSFGGGKINYDGTALSVSGAITATSGQIGRWDISNGGQYLKGVSLSSEEVEYICGLEKSSVSRTDSSYLDKYGFTVHNSYKSPYFYYWVREVSIGAESHFMIMEEALAQGISAISGAVDIVRVYQGIYQGTHLIGEVVSTNHGSTFAVGSLHRIETSDSGNILKGQLEPITNTSVISSMTLQSFDDDLGMFNNTNDERYYNPLYSTAKSMDGSTVYINNDETKTNLLLSYTIDNVITGYTYLNATSDTMSTTPILAINTQLSPSDETPDFATSKTVLYSDGTIKAESLDTNTIKAESTNSNSITANLFIADGTGEFMISDCNYSNITLWKYVENILKTHRLIG